MPLAGSQHRNPSSDFYGIHMTCQADRYKEPITDGYRVWGHGRSWTVEHYNVGQLTWHSEWFSSKERADAEMLRLQGGK